MFTVFLPHRHKHNSCQTICRKNQTQPSCRLRVKVTDRQTKARQSKYFNALWTVSLAAAVILLASPTRPAHAAPWPEENETSKTASAESSAVTDYEPYEAGQENCKEFPSAESPILRWCENNQTFTYEITTWNETKYFSKRKIKDAVRKAVLNFVAEECQAKRLHFKTAQAELWLAVPWSGAELAQPRIGMQLDNTHFIFSNAWEEKFEANISNMHILEKRSYDTFSGDSLSGINPEKITFRAKQEYAGGEIGAELKQLLTAVGVIAVSKLRGSLPLFSATVARYQEQEVVNKIKSKEEIQELIEWVEPSYKVEAIGDRFNLFSESIASKDLPRQCR